MECRDCKKELQGGFGIGHKPYKEFLCARCIEFNMMRQERDNAVAEAKYYLKSLYEIWDVCGPSRQGHFKRGLGNTVLGLVADATSYRDRQMIVSESGE